MRRNIALSKRDRIPRNLITLFDFLNIEASLKERSRAMSVEKKTNGIEGPVSDPNTYASIEKGKYALKRDFNASTR